MTNQSNALTNRSGSLQSSQLDYILVDGSGSMRSKWWDFMQALDSFMETLKAQNIHSHGIVSVFDTTDIDCVQRDSLVSEWETFYKEPLGAHFGGTPLYDAINVAVRKIKDLNPSKVSLVIVTDGEESDSHYTDAEQARAILNWVRAKGWQVTFLGCDFNNSKQAKLLGINDSNAIGVQKKLLGEAGKVLGKKRVNNVLYGQDMNFTENEKTQFGGFLEDKTGDTK